MKFPRFTKPMRLNFEFAPFASVAFALLLLLAFRTQLTRTPGALAALRLPALDGLPGVSGPSAVVALDAGGLLYHDGQVVAEPVLRERLAAQRQLIPGPATLIIEADRDARVEMLLKLTALARELGFEEAVQATRPPLPRGSRAGTTGAAPRP